ncbi:MAG: RNA polymerase sigma factor [Lachnospiraceae bacterium]|nr:RNA polymerase sigma factor [Lachnospiraceae bacterium]
MERFMELYETVYKDMYRLAYYYLGNPQDAEDAVSEAVLKAYENFASLRQEEAFRAWIFKILVNQCKGYLRKKNGKESYELKAEPSYHPSLEDYTLTRDLLSGLSEEERRIVALTVFGGYKGEEIAKILNRRHSTIRSKYRRALKKLEQQILAEEVHS